MAQPDAGLAKIGRAEKEKTGAFTIAESRRKKLIGYYASRWFEESLSYVKKSLTLLD
jgi:hypothetical protein